MPTYVGSSRYVKRYGKLVSLSGEGYGYDRQSDETSKKIEIDEFQSILGDEDE